MSALEFELGVTGGSVYALCLFVTSSNRQKNQIVKLTPIKNSKIYHTLHANFWPLTRESKINSLNKIGIFGVIFTMLQLPYNIY